MPTHHTGNEMASLPQSSTPIPNLLLKGLRFFTAYDLRFRALGFLGFRGFRFFRV